MLSSLKLASWVFLRDVQDLFAKLAEFALQQRTALVLGNVWIELLLFLGVVLIAILTA